MRVRQLLRTFHRWLGAALCLLFLTWIVSGIVMTFAGFPSIHEREKLARASALRKEGIWIQPPVLAGVAADADSIELGALGARAIYRVRTAARTTSVFADTGERLNLLDEHAAISAASSWLHGPIAASTRLTEVDQWTPQADRYGELPFLQVSARDREGTQIYVSLVDGEVLQQTTTRTRFLAWIGAIPHWIYPIQLRRHAAAWRTLVIALSALGALASAAGLVHGIAIARFARRSTRGRRLSLSPFRDRSLAWHHVLGLTFGVFSFTWVLSGMLSFYPLASSAESEPAARDVSAFRGAPLDPRSFSRNLVEALTECQRSLGGDVKRVQLVVAGHAPFYVCADGRGASRILSADSHAPPSPALENTRIASFARALGDGASVESETLLEKGDAYYYPTHFEPDLAFPILRTRFTGGLVTYVNPRSLRVERRYSSGGAAYRWLYHGIHSLDFPALYQRSWLWHPVIVTALLGASLLAASGIWVSLRWTAGRSSRRGRAHHATRSNPDLPEIEGA